MGCTLTENSIVCCDDSQPELTEDEEIAQYDRNCRELERDGYRIVPMDMPIPCDGYDFVMVGPETTLYVKENPQARYDSRGNYYEVSLTI